MGKTHNRRRSSECSLHSFAEFKATKPNEVDGKKVKVNRLGLYKLLFSSWLPIVAVIPAFCVGSTPIFYYLVFGNILNAHSKYNADRNYNVMKDVIDGCIYLVDIALASAVCRFLTTFCWIRVGSQFSKKLKKDLFKSMMSNDVTFFDTNTIGGIMTLLSEDAQNVQDAFGSTKGTQIQSLSQIVIGMLLCYIWSRKIALVLTCFLPIAFITVKQISQLIDIHANLKFQYISESMTVAEETISSIRTVRTFNNEKLEVKRFMNHIKSTEKEDKKINGFVVIMSYLLMFILWCIIVGSMYWGGTMVMNNELEAGDLFSLFGFIAFGGFAMIEFQASLQGEQRAIASGDRIIKLTKSTPTIPFEGGKKIENFKEKIEFKNVTFKYPTRDVFVLKDVSFTVLPGQISALVGHSGSGKSTSIQLIERYYDVDSGSILLDDVDIKELDIHWLHQKIGLVSQEPVLFQMSIKDNIKYGARKASFAQVDAAAEIANAKKFIMKFEKKYDQMVGEKGSTLSGGQRQRIAIARAVIKDPVILMTDEATSALDAESERKVQDALDKVMKNRTALIVAHRLSTIKNAHVIYVFDSGEIKEYGNHTELLEKKGVYYELVKLQLTEDKVKQENENENKEDGKKDKKNPTLKKKVEEKSSESSNSSSSSASSSSKSSEPKSESSSSINT
ncbi:ABC transporter family protein [Tritrichomonas foetus]|uniref:ABC transporter family protein n=1 Tax=Tritrichomonas foetus TaxID=1144522 RepID=A0A1J4KKT6_9EUKA|nr:ABC transporter family protein [Tritrichomonas foetus]|eukprot:OHT10310.1 ABC transporter family protein [Tritrichomonas foetus]